MLNARPIILIDEKTLFFQILRKASFKLNLSMAHYFERDSEDLMNWQDGLTGFYRIFSLINCIGCFTFDFQLSIFFHSVLKLFTGFARAALIAWKLTVNSVINNAPKIAEAKTHQ